LERKKVDGWARAAIRSSAVDDIRKDDVGVAVMSLFEEL